MSITLNIPTFVFITLLHHSHITHTRSLLLSSSLFSISHTSHTPDHSHNLSSYYLIVLSLQTTSSADALVGGEWGDVVITFSNTGLQASAFDGDVKAIDLSPTNTIATTTTSTTTSTEEEVVPTTTPIDTTSTTATSSTEAQQEAAATLAAATAAVQANLASQEAADAAAAAVEVRI